eukprot:15342661-Ditylum_brightwellii.AAC.3
MLTLCKHLKTADAEVGSGFDPSAISFIPKPPTLKTENSQDFNLCITATSKSSTDKFKAHTFANGSPKDVLEWKKKMQKIIKCKPVDMAKGKFDLVKVILNGDALTHWLTFKQVDIVLTSKKPIVLTCPHWEYAIQHLQFACKSSRNTIS